MYMYIVASNQQNIHVLHTLLYDLKKIMKKYYCWGRPLGSTILWEQHLQTLEKICQMANTIAIKQVSYSLFYLKSYISLCN